MFIICTVAMETGVNSGHIGFFSNGFLSYILASHMQFLAQRYY